MDRRNIWRIIIIAIVVLIVAQVLNSVLSIASFEKIYCASLIAKFRIIGSDLKRKIETAVNFGKPIEKFRGIDIILKHYMEKEGQLSNISLTLPDGTVLYSTDTNSLHKTISFSPLPWFKEDPDISKDEHYEANISIYNNRYYITLPIYYENKRWVGSVHIQFDKKVISRQIHRMIGKSSQYLLIVSGVALVVMIFLVFIVNWLDSRRSEGKDRRISLNTKNFVSITFVLIVSQSAYTYLNNTYFQQSYIKIVNINVSTLSRLVKDEIDHILRMGVPINRLKKMEVLLRDIVRNVPECREIKILDTDRLEQYRATKEKVASVFDPDFEQQMLPHIENSLSIVLEGKKDIEGFAIFIINKSVIDQQTYDLSLDSLTIIVVSLLFGFEILFFTSIFTSGIVDIKYDVDKK